MVLTRYQRLLDIHRDNASDYESDDERCAPDPPDEFVCPITYELMVDPMIAPDGNTYERTAVVRALRTNGVLPLSRQRASVGDLITNRVLKNMIRNWCTQHNITPPSINISDNNLNNVKSLERVNNQIEQEINHKPLIFVIIYYIICLISLISQIITISIFLYYSVQFCFYLLQFAIYANCAITYEFYLQLFSNNSTSF